MKPVHLLAVSAVVSALLIFAAAKADAQSRAVRGGPRFSPRPEINVPVLGFPGVFVVEREVVHVVERETVREVQLPPPPPPPAPRKPYVIGTSYSSLPGGCMKMIENGASYYHCSGEWYRQVGGQYRAVAQP